MELNGGGKYDAICEDALFKAKAVGVLMVVLGGEHGTGFTMSALDKSVIEETPEILEAVAQQIRAARDKVTQ